MRMPNPRAQPGFTLAEVLISLALMAFLMTAAALGIEAAQSAHAYNAEKTELVTRARAVLDRINRDMRRATEFSVLDTHTLQITLADGMIHTYSWDGAVGGNVTYTQTDTSAITTTPITLTGYVQDFTVTDATTVCEVRLALKGTLAQTDITATAIPRKSLF